MSVVNINNIKEQFKQIMDAANDTLASYDLSTGMNRRVQRVLKVNPLKIPIDADLFPYVSIYLDEKEIELDTIGGSQTNAPRTGFISLNVIGAVYEINTPDINEDEADEQIEVLMENVEEILRRNYKLNGTVLWTKPERCAYHSFPLSEDAHLRYGLLTVNARVQY